MCEDDELRGEAIEDDSDDIDAVRTRDWARPSGAGYELRFNAIVGGSTGRVRVVVGRATQMFGLGCRAKYRDQEDGGSDS